MCYNLHVFSVWFSSSRRKLALPPTCSQVNPISRPSSGKKCPDFCQNRLFKDLAQKTGELWLILFSNVLKRLLHQVESMRSWSTGRLHWLAISSLGRRARLHQIPWRQTNQEAAWVSGLKSSSESLWQLLTVNLEVKVVPSIKTRTSGTSARQVKS